MRSGVDVVQVGVEHDGRGLARPLYASDDVAGLVEIDLVVAELFHFGRDEPGNGFFFAGQARGPDQALEKIDAGVQVGHRLSGIVAFSVNR